jgi:H+/gluconate symporter-like permease
MDVIGIIGVLLGIAVMIFLVCWQNWNILLATFVASFIVAITNGLNIWTAFSEYYLTGAADWVKTMLIIFTLGALLGRVMQRTGSAQSLGRLLARIIGKKRMGLVIFLLSWLLVYGGVDNIVACLTLCPIAMQMAKEANVPRRYAFACFLGGACSFAMSMPGSPIIHNLMPTWILGTSLTAAFKLGMVIVFFNILFVWLWIRHLKKKAAKTELGFDVSDERAMELYNIVENDVDLPSAASGLVSLLIVILSSIILGGVLGLNSTTVVCGSLLLAIIVNLVWNFKFIGVDKSETEDSSVLLPNAKALKKFRTVPLYKILEEGATDGILGCILCASVLGWVGVVQTTSAFAAFADWTNGLGSSLSYLGIFISIQLMAMVTGNSPGTLSVFLNNFAPGYLAMGMNPAVVHRIATTSCMGFDCMPHNPGTITYLRTFHLSYREAYIDVFMCCCVAPGAAAFLGSLLAIAGLN